jgi:hypothetical protein
MGLVVFAGDEEGGSDGDESDADGSDEDEREEFAGDEEESDGDGSDEGGSDEDGSSEASGESSDESQAARQVLVAPTDVGQRLPSQLPAGGQPWARQLIPDSESEDEDSDEDEPLVPLCRKYSARARGMRPTVAAPGPVPHLDDVDQEDVTGIRVAAVPLRRQKKMDKASDILTVPLSPVDGSPVFQVPNYSERKGGRYLPVVTMLVSVLSHQHQLRETCFLEGKWKAEAEAGVDAEPPLLEVQLLELVKNVVKGTTSQSTMKRGLSKAGNLESIISGTAQEVDRWDVAGCVARYLEKTCVRVAALRNFSKDRWTAITEETNIQFVVVADPSRVPQDVQQFHQPHAKWKLVFAADSGGGADAQSRTPPTFSFANVNPEKTLWTTVKNGEEERRRLPEDMLQTLRAANVYVYQRVVNAKEVYHGKMINFLGQQIKVRCAWHNSPLVKMGRGNVVCSRRACENKSSYQCREVDEERNECRISLCTKHFKHANAKQRDPVLIKWQSKPPKPPEQPTHKVTLTVPAIPEDNNGTEEDPQPPAFDPSDEVQPPQMTAQEAQLIEDFAAVLDSALGGQEDVVCEISPNAESPFSAVFQNPDRQAGQYLFNE